jgi:hypothetical protein
LIEKLFQQDISFFLFMLMSNKFIAIIVPLWFLSIISKDLQTGTRGPALCEKSCGPTFSSIQKQQLCENSYDSTGPGLCATGTRGMQLQFSDVLELCRGASSAMPSKCLESLNSKNRQAHGVLLCAGSSSIFPAKCFEELSGYKGPLQIKNTSAIVDFCRSREAEDNHDALKCVHAAATGSPEFSKILPTVKVDKSFVITPQQALEACSSTIFGNATVLCIQDMQQLKQHFFGKSVATTPKGRLAMVDDAVELCASSIDYERINPTIFSSFEQDMLKYVDNVGLLSAVGRCMGLMSNQESWLTDKSKLTQHTNQFSMLSIKDKMSLCRSAYSPGTGPALCAFASTLKASSRLDSSSLISLCSGSKDSAPVRCLQESEKGSNVPSLEKRVKLCSGATSSVTHSIKQSSACENQIELKFSRDQRCATGE